jgi:hypothetical protein
MTTEPIDTRRIAAQELADSTVPTPDDAFEDLGPFAQLLWLHDGAYVTLKLWTAMLSDEAAGIDEDAPDVTEALTAISLACGNLDAACIAVGILEPSAKVPEQTS